MDGVLHSAWACHQCGKRSEQLFLTSCGCPYHIGCVPVRCYLHDKPTVKLEQVDVPRARVLTRRELLRAVQAASLKGVSMAELLLTADIDDILHLESKGLLFFSPHRTAVFDSKCLSTSKQRA